MKYAILLFAFLASPVLASDYREGQSTNLHNASAIGLGWVMATLARQRGANLRAMVIEISMHHSGLALGLIFTQFGAQPDMALIAALWGTWHIVSGLLLVALWRRNPPLMHAEKEEKSCAS